MDILKTALAEIKATKEEEIEANKLIDSILRRIKVRDAKAVLGGSGAKGTWLKSYDADIFVQFNYSKYKEKSSQLSDILGKALKKEFPKAKRLHGSRDYFQIVSGKHTFEIVPILEIRNSSQAKNITDVSPLHTKWVRKHILADEIRLTKQFLKCQKVYGAESYIQGFSGYVCEILTIHYGSFSKLVNAMAKWKEKQIIDVESHFKGKNPMAEINKSKLQSPIIVIDPVQPDRNAAAALSFEKFDLARQAAKKYIKKPSMDFFRKEEFSVEKLKAPDRRIILATALPEEGKRDVIGAKLLKAFMHIKQTIVSRGFKLLDSGWEWQKEAQLFFAIDKAKLSPKIERRGPIMRQTRFVNEFKDKHKETFVKGDRIYAVVERKIRDGEKLVNELKDDLYLKDKAKDISYKII